ncbi:MAG: hypothetical protein K9W43_00075 [Candidatus Thorarchaeota archaeon]|nr:hypothetical protein [Candidatus Thorarchaeota archaeon]
MLFKFQDDSSRSRRVLVIAVLLLLISPGALLIFITDSRIAPFPLIVMVIVSAVFLYWLVHWHNHHYIQQDFL